MGVCISSIQSTTATHQHNEDVDTNTTSHNPNQRLSNILMDPLPDSIEPAASHVSSSSGYESSEGGSETSSVGNTSGVCGSVDGRFIVLRTVENSNVVSSLFNSNNGDRCESTSEVVRKYVALDRNLGSSICYVKEIRSNTITSVIKNEIDSLRLCVGYSGIVQLIEVQEKPHKVRIVTEYVDGDTWGSLKMRNYGGTVSQVRNILRDVLRALQYMHDEAGIAHMDIKPENIRILRDPTAEGTCVKLMDLCYSVKCEDGYTSSTAGTWYYCSPEKLRGISPYCAKAADVWALGVTALVAIFGEPDVPLPRSQQNRHHVPTIPKVLPGGTTVTPPLLIDLLRSMLDRDPTNRPSAAKLLGHDFFGARLKNLNVLS